MAVIAGLYTSYIDIGTKYKDSSISSCIYRYSIYSDGLRGSRGGNGIRDND